jgi:RNA polymerase sigma factor (sigma-70 family)
MFSSKLKPDPLDREANRRTNEAVFSAYYSRLAQWAVQITRNGAEAEDLVHDVYLRLDRISRSLDEIEDLEPYLFKILRNLYYSRLRRAGRDPLNDLSIVDYDSLEQGLAVADRRSLFLVRDDLRTVCRYACERKITVRSASVLILRFFHGYFPTEVMKILRASRSSVDLLLHTARNEARLHLQRPDAIRCVSSSMKNSIVFSKRGESAQQLFLELQEAIFSNPDGECFDPDDLEQRYKEGTDFKSFSTRELSHLVSCRTCIEHINTLLHLSPLSDRSPEDGIGRNGGNGGSGPTEMHRRSLKSQTTSRSQRRVREIYEHRPQSLQIVVDGEVRSSQNITAEVNEFRLKLSRAEKPGFIEILSEQGYCLIFLQVLDAHSADALEQIESASFSDDRSLNLTLQFAPDGAIVHVQYCDPVMAEIDISRINFVSTIDNRLGVNHRPGLESRSLIARLRNVFSLGVNPILAGAAIAVAAFAICLWLRPQLSPATTPAALLQHAELAENVLPSESEAKIVYQKLRIQTPKRTYKREVYRDPSGRRKPRAEKLEPHVSELKDKLLSVGVDWNNPLSAATYQLWRDHSHVVRDSVQETGENLLTLTTVVSDMSISQESLTVRKSDFHPVARSVSFRDNGSVEIAELDYAVLGWSPGFAPLFEAADSSKSFVAPSGSRLPKTEQLDLAELQVRQELHDQGADLGQDIHITRSPRDIIVSGIASNDEAAQSLRASLARIPHVSLVLSSPEESRMRQHRLVESPSAGDSVELVDPLLAEQLVKRVPDDIARTQLIDHLLAEADNCRWHARALDALLERYNSLDEPKVRQIADDHLQALARSSSAIAAWIDTVSDSMDGSQQDTAESSQIARGHQLTDESRGLEHDMAELLTAHRSDKTSSDNAALIAASCQRHVKTIQRLVTTLR